MFGAAVALSFISLGDNARATSVVPVTWSGQTFNIASASINPIGRLDLAVYKTSFAEEDADLGDLSGILSISYNYSITAEGWYEVALLSSSTNGESIFNIPACSDYSGFSPSVCGDILAKADPSNGMDVVPFGTTNGSVSVTLPVTGETHVYFAITPSIYSHNSDHFSTLFNVTNIAFDLRPSAAPEPATWALMLAGFGAIGFATRHRRSTYLASLTNA